jgi:hypothetical protein
MTQQHTLWKGHDYMQPIHLQTRDACGLESRLASHNATAVQCSGSDGADGAEHVRTVQRRKESTRTSIICDALQVWWT